MFSGEDSVNSALLGLQSFLFKCFELNNKNTKTRVWTRGTHFDISILEYAWEMCVLGEYPWNFRSIRDLRTAMDLFDVEVEKNPNLHDALEDCKSQAISLRKVLAKQKAL